MIAHRSETNQKLNIDTEPAIEVASVSFTYAKRQILTGLDLALQNGEMVGLLGPNGSGKTTLIKLVAGLLVPDSGEISVNGKAITSSNRIEMSKMLAVVSQEMHVPFNFTVQQMVEMGRTPYLGRLGKMSSHDIDVVHKSMELTHVEHFHNRIYNQLSGGEKQRVLLAMALAQEPQILLLDEPTSHLDVKHQAEILELAQQLNREEKLTVLASLHDLNLAARYFPRLVLFQGSIVADGSPAEVLDGRVLSWVYETPMNVGFISDSEHISTSIQKRSGVKEPSYSHDETLVHVIGGCGSAVMVMRALADAEIPFSLGPINIGDTDFSLGLKLASKVVAEQPYSSMSPEVISKMRCCLQQAKAQIIAPFAVGPGNISVLREALHGISSGKPTVIISDIDLSQSDHPQEAYLKAAIERDYTSGEAVKIFEEIFSYKPVLVDTIYEACENIREMVLSR